MRLLLKNGRVVDPANKIDEVRDVLIEELTIVRSAKDIEPTRGCQVIDCSGKTVIPGLVDMHVHLREPGREDKETVATGTRAGLHGGVTSVLAMPNTYPAMDSPEHVALLAEAIKDRAECNVYICAAITRGRAGKELVDMERLAEQGCRAFSDDGASVDSAELMLEAFQNARTLKVPVVCHCEDKQLSNTGMINLGYVSTRLGLRGISAESEWKRVQRDIDLAEKVQAAVHICHISCAGSIEAVARAKKKGVRVTCETAPHYFTLCEEDLLGYDTNLKMNPPLRSKSDMLAIRQALADGTIDAIASDHAPHTISEKDIEFDRAEFGVIGLETELSVAITQLVLPGILSWPGLVEKMSLNPSRILGIDRGTLGDGAAADIVVVDPAATWLVARKEFFSKSKNSPFTGRSLNGVVEYTIRNGRIAYRAG